MPKIFMIGFFMRFAAQILAMLLAITSIAVPCLAKTQIERTATTSIVVVDDDADVCKGACIKAIVSRQNDVDRAAIVQDLNTVLILESGQPFHYTAGKFAATFKTSKPACSYPVDLHVLCRQLK